MPKAKALVRTIRRISFIFLLLVVTRLGLGEGVWGSGTPPMGRLRHLGAFRPDLFREVWFKNKKRSLRRRARKRVLRGGLGRLWLRV